MKYIGMDAHSRECFFVVLGKGGRVLRRAVVNTSEKVPLLLVRDAGEAQADQRRQGVRQEACIRSDGAQECVQVGRVQRVEIGKEIQRQTNGGDATAKSKLP